MSDLESESESEASRDIFVDVLQPWLDTTDSIFFGAQVIILGFDRELRYRAWNSYAEKVTGYPAEKVIGQRAIDVFPSLREIGFLGMMERALAGESVTMPSHVYRHHITGEERRVTMTYMPLRGSVAAKLMAMNNLQLGDERDEIQGILVVGRDTTTRAESGDGVTLPKEAHANEVDLRNLSRTVLTAQGQDKAIVDEAARDPYETLSGREREVLQHVAEGMTNAEIGTRLSISRRTVEVHRANVMRKLGLRSQAALIRYALRRNLIRLDP